MAGIKRSSDLVIIRDCRGWLLINFLDHVAFLQFGRAAIRLDACNDDAVRIVWQIELVRHLWSQLVNLN